MPQNYPQRLGTLKSSINDTKEDFKGKKKIRISEINLSKWKLYLLELKKKNLNSDSVSKRN